MIVAGLIGYAIWTAKKRPVPSFCILWYFGNLVIESSIFPLEMVFEQRLYIPSTGPIILFSLFLSEIFNRLRMKLVENRRLINRLSAFSMLSIMILLCLGTYQRNSFWRDEIKLLEDGVTKSPDKFRPYYNLGPAYYGAGKLQEAVKAFRQAIALKSDNDEFHYNLGLTFNRLEDHRDTVDAYRVAIRINRGNLKAHFNLGLSYSLLGKRSLATEEYKILKDLDQTRAEKLLALIRNTSTPPHSRPVNP